MYDSLGKYCWLISCLFDVDVVSHMFFFFFLWFLKQLKWLSAL